MTTKLLLRLLEDLDSDAVEARSKASELTPLPVKKVCTTWTCRHMAASVETPDCSRAMQCIDAFSLTRL